MRFKERIKLFEEDESRICVANNIKIIVFNKLLNKIQTIPCNAVPSYICPLNNDCLLVVSAERDLRVYDKDYNLRWMVEGCIRDKNLLINLQKLMMYPFITNYCDSNTQIPWMRGAHELFIVNAMTLQMHEIKGFWRLTQDDSPVIGLSVVLDEHYILGYGLNAQNNHIVVAHCRNTKISNHIDLRSFSISKALSRKF